MTSKRNGEGDDNQAGDLVDDDGIEGGEPKDPDQERQSKFSASQPDESTQRADHPAGKKNFQRLHLTPHH
jgi:hypothetical protein